MTDTASRAAGERVDPERLSPLELMRSSVEAARKTLGPSIHSRNTYGDSVMNEQALMARAREESLASVTKPLWCPIGGLVFPAGPCQRCGACADA